MSIVADRRTSPHALDLRRAESDRAPRERCGAPDFRPFRPTHPTRAGDAGRRIVVPFERMGVAKTDEELMLAYAQGDVRAFDTLYGRQRGMLYRFILRSVADRASADELYQETWSRLIASRTRYRAEAKFSTWLLQIAHNLIVDSFRRARPQAGPEETETVLRELDAPESERPEQALSAFEQRRRLQLALEGLPSEQREAFLLRVESGLGLEEIGAITGAGHETVKSRLRYAFAKLREKLNE
jgi:RNA polymerase sigma-70 factor (ECF subfamily)